MTSAEATTYYWDEDGTTSGFGTAGSTWTAPTVDLWSTDLTGETAPGGSITTTTSDALFFGTDTLGLAAGTITVSGTVSANSLTFGSASGAILLSGGTITLDGTTPTITVNNAADSISSIIAGTAGLSKDGSGTLTLTGTNTYTGGTTVSAGTLQLVNSASGNAILGAGHNYVVASGATLEFNRTAGIENISTFNLSGAGTFKTSGAAPIIQTSLGSTVAMGSGALFHVESGSYTFGAAGIGDWSSNLSDMQVDSGATFDGSATPIVVNALNGSGTVLTGGGITLGVDNGSGTFSGVIGNSSFGSAFSITKAGSGTQTLSGANTYTGTTTLAAGTLQADVADVAATSGALGNGGNITFTGGTLQYTANSAGTDYSSRIVNSTSAMKFDTNGQNVTLATDFARSNTSGLIKEGAGKLIVEAESGSAAFAGDKIVNGGTLQLFNDEVFNLGYANQGEFFINNGSTLEFASGGGNRHIIQGSKFTFDSNGGGTIDSTNSLMIVQNYGGLNTFTTTGGAKNLITGSNRFNLQNGNTLFFNVATGTDDVDLEVYTNITSGSIEKGGAGTLSLTNASNTLYSGGSQGITINAGTLEIGGAGRLQNGSFVGNINNAGIFKHNSTAGQTLSGVISGTGALVKDNTGGLTLSGANTYSGTTTVSAGTLTLDYATQDNSKLSDTAALTLAGNTLTLAGGTHTEVVGETILSAGTASTVTRTSGTSVLQMNEITRNAGASLDFGAASIANTDTLNTNGILGAWATINGTDFAMNSTNGADGDITAYNSYTDVARLTPGTIADGSTTNVRIVEGSGSAGNITLGAATTTVNTLNQSDSGGTGGATIDTASNTLQTNGILVGTGAGDLTIGTAVDSGTLKSATSGGELVLQNFGNLTINAVIADNTTASSVMKAGSGTATLSGANTYTGTTTVYAGTLSLNNENALQNSTLDTGTSGSQQVTFGAGANYNIGGLKGADDLVLSGGKNIFVGSNNSDTTFSGVLNVVSGGGGTLTKVGDGTLTLSGANTHTATYIGIANGADAGTVSIEKNSALGLDRVEFGAGGTVNLGVDGLVVNNNFFIYNRTSNNDRIIRLDLDGSNTGEFTGTFDIRKNVFAADVGADDTLTFSGQLRTGAGSGGLKKNGLGTLVLTNRSNSYSGGTTVNAGILSLNGANSTVSLIGDGTLTINAGAQVDAYVNAFGSTYQNAIVINGGILNSAAADSHINTVEMTGGQITGSQFNPHGDFTINASANQALISSNVSLAAANIDFNVGDGAQASDLLVSGVISSGNGLSKSGAGTMTLSGANTYTGATTISAGTLQLGDGSTTGTLSASSAISVGSGATFAVNRSSAATQGTDFSSAAITGAGGFTQAGSGTTILNATNTYTGGTTVSAGTLRLVNSASGDAIRGSVHNYAVASGATLEFNRTGGSEGIDTFNLSGAGTFKTSGLAMAQTSAGSTVAMGSGALFHVESGTYRFGATGTGDWSSNLSDMQVDSGATFDGAATPIVVNALNGSGTVLTGGGITLGVDNGSGTFSGVIGNSGFGGSAFSITKSGSGTQTLSGANTYTGATTLNQGTITFGTGTLATTTGALSVNNTNTTAAGTAAVLNLSTAADTTTGSLSGSISAPISGTNTATINTQTGRTLTVNQTADDTYAGVIAGAGNFTLGSLSTNTLTLTGTNTYTGGTTVSAGTLRLVNSASGDAIRGAGHNYAVASGATLEFNRTAGIENISTFNLSGAGTFKTSGAAAIIQTSAGSTVAMGSGALFHVESGSYTFGAGGIGDWSSNLSDMQVNSGATFDGAATPTVIDALNGSGTVLTGGGITLGVDNGSGTFSGVIGNASFGSAFSITKAGSGTQTLSGANTYTGATTVSAGTLQISGAGSLSTSSAVVNNANLIYGTTTASDTYGLSSSTTGTGTLTGTAQLIQLNGDITQGTVNLTSGTNGSLYEKGIELVADTTITAGSITLTGDLGRSGSSGGNLALDTSATNGAINLDVSIGRSSDWYGFNSFTADAGTGTLTVSGANAASGDWRGTSSASLTGTLNISSSFSLSGTGAGNLDLTATGNSSVTGDLALANTTNTWTVNPGLTMDVSGVISGTSAAITKNGDGTLILSGTNTYSGATTVTNGILALNNTTTSNTTIAGDVNTATFDVTISGGTLRNDANEQIANNASITMSSGAYSLNGTTETIDAFTNSGGTFTTGTGTLIGLGNTITWSGGTNTINDGGTVQDTHWDVSGGTNTVQGGTTGGTLHVQSGGTGFEFTGTGAPTITLNSDNTAAGRMLLEGNLSVASSITGTATIETAGAGSIDGFIDMNGGTRTFTVNDGAPSIDLLITADITNGGLTKAGLGTMEISGDNTYDGITNISAGTLLVNGDNSLANGNVNINSGGTLGGIGTIGGATVLNSGGFLSPGDGGAGDTITFLSSLDIQNASVGSLLFDLDAPGTSDLVAMDTGAQLTIASLSVADFIFTNLGSAAEGDYTLFTTVDTAIAGIGTLDTTMNLIQLSPSGPQFNARLSTNDFAIDGNQFIALTLSAVPEPSSTALLGLGALALMLRRKRS